MPFQVVQRSLDGLVESGDVHEKVYNKQHVYVFEQVLLRIFDMSLKINCILIIYKIIIIFVLLFKNGAFYISNYQTRLPSVPESVIQKLDAQIADLQKVASEKTAQLRSFEAGNLLLHHFYLFISYKFILNIKCI